MRASSCAARVAVLGALAACSLGCSLLAGDDFGGYRLTTGSTGGAGGSGHGGDAAGGGTAGGGAAGGGGAPPCDATYTNAVGADKPDGYWKLDEHAGDTALFEAGGPGTYVGAVQLGVPGATASCDAAVEFPLNTQLRMEAPFEYPGTHPFSLEVWIHDASNGFAIAETDGPNGYGLQVGPGDTVEFDRWDQGNTDMTTATRAGTWSHVVATYDGAKMRLYVNGLFAAQAVAQHPTGAVTSPVFIVSVPGFSGALDEVAVYDHALSAQAVKAHHDAAHAP